MKISITFGDFSLDGHKISEIRYYESNRTVDELRNIYHETVLDTGFDFVKEVCAEFEDRVIQEDVVEIFKELNIVLYSEINDDNEIVIDSVETYFKYFLRFLHLTDPKIELVEIINDVPELTFYGYLTDKNGHKWHMGQLGYGLFST